MNSCLCFRTSSWISRGISPYSKRTYPKCNAAILFFYFPMEFFNKFIYIVSSPVTFVSKLSSIFSELCIVRVFLSFYFIRIEIVIHVNSVNIVISYYFNNTVNNIIMYFRYSRIQIQLSSIYDCPFRPFSSYIIFRKTFCAGRLPFHCKSVRIKPCMKFYTSFMCFINHKFQRIISRIYSLSSCKIFRPWRIF